MIRNITKQIKRAIAVDAPWSFSDFYHIIQILEQKGFSVSHWKGEEDWATILDSEELIAYVWLKYPLIFVKADHFDEIRFFVQALTYIVLINSFDLISQEFALEMDEDLTNRIGDLEEKNNFSANDLWFHTSN